MGKILTQLISRGEEKLLLCETLKRSNSDQSNTVSFLLNSAILKKVEERKDEVACKRYSLVASMRTCIRPMHTTSPSHRRLWEGLSAVAMVNAL